MDSKPVMSLGEIGVLGASSFVGMQLFEFAAVYEAHLIPFSRTPASRGGAYVWRGISASEFSRSEAIHQWISLCPVTALADLLPMLELAGVRKLVAVSSTSLITKKKSANPRERRLAASLEKAELRVCEWAAREGVEAVLLRTTLTYDGIHDANIAAMARFVRRWRMLPILKPATGLRQPLHARDLAMACLEALARPLPLGCYNLSGGETLAYHEMAGRVFDALNMPRRFFPIPACMLNAIDTVSRCLPAGWRFPTSVFRRMNADLVFDHGPAAQDLNFRPRGFDPSCFLEPATSRFKQ
jgi:nucleoside-diphosphate-sugar epimerase